MKIWNISELSEYTSLLFGKGLDEDGLRWVYRGQRVSSWDLLPQLDRSKSVAYRVATEIMRDVHEAQLLKDFKKIARPYLKSEIKSSDELLALAQHHGLATRLLDWSYNPLVALFFAVEGDCDEDSIVWGYKHGGGDWSGSLDDALASKEVRFFDPPYLTERIVAQSACFTVHPEMTSNDMSSWRGDFLKITITGQARERLCSQLMELGISRLSLFPGLDGSASYVNLINTRIIGP